MKLNRIFALVLTIIICLGLVVTPVSGTSLSTDKEITILFTHDLHSHLLPSKNESGEGEYGGYARLMTAILAEKAKDPGAILVDGGDFSMGSLFQTAYPTSAIELRMMGAMGYDATTFGNHEFDYLQSGLKGMLNAAISSGDPLPTIVATNYLPPREGQDGYDAELWAAYNDYGVKDYTIVERDGVYYVIFGVFGVDADDCAPNSGMIFENMADAAKRTVAAAVAECENKYGAHPVVVCLSHAGTENGGGEDVELARAVDGIDVIISGHTHTTITELLLINDTYIVSAAEYGRYLGVLKFKLDGDSKTFVDYKLVAIDETIPEDPTIAAMVEGFKGEVEKEYLSKYGYTFDQVLVENTYTFDTVKQVSATAHESTLGNLIADAYKWSVEKATGKKVDVAITAAGVIRGSLPIGDVTVSDVFNIASLGVGTEGELIGIYLTGKDLKNAIELDASVQPMMSTAQLFMSGAEYSFNTYRMIFNKVDYVRLQNEDGTLSKIENDKLYYVVAGMYMGQMLGSVKETSYGLLSITPRDENGNPIATEDLVKHVIKDENGNPLKEWYSISDYLDNMDGKVDAKYAAPDGRKVVYSSLNPIKLLKNPNIFTIVVVVLGVSIIGGIVFAVLGIVKGIKKRKAKKNKA